MNYKRSHATAARALLRRWLLAILFACALFQSPAALADVPCRVNGIGDTTIRIPSPISVSPGGTYPRVLGPDWTSVSTGTWFSCDILWSGILQSERWGVGVALTDATSAFASTGTTWDGFTIYASGYPNVGIQVGHKSTMGACGTYSVMVDLPWKPAPNLVPAPYGGFVCSSPATESYPNYYPNSPFGVQLFARLVQLGPISPGTFAGGVVARAAGFRTTTPSDGYVTYLPNPFSLVPGVPETDFRLASVVFNVLSCSVNDVTVPLVTASASAFQGSQVVNEKAFQLTVSCPAGLSAVRWKLNPTSTAIDANNGTFTNAYIGADKARGVGLRITEGSGVGIRFGTLYPLSGYNATTGSPSLPVPFRGSYYRTDTESVAGGKVTGVVEVTLDYQ